MRGCTHSIATSAGEVVFEVIALLVLGALCASGLFVAAAFYRKRQSTRRQIQNNVAMQRTRHFEKLQQQQQQQQKQQQQHRQQDKLRRSLEAARAPAQMPTLHSQQPSQGVTVKHTRSRTKASEPTIPSSPSASSSHSEAIGTNVRPPLKSEKAAEPKRARSAQRSSADFAFLDKLQHGLDRSQSDLCTETSQHGPFECSQPSMTSGKGSMHITPASEPSTPSSIAGFTTPNPFQQASSPPQTPHSCSESSKAASVDSITPGLHAKQAGSKRRNRHKSKSAKKSAPTKRRFIPGLDTEFDPAIHELPATAQDSSADLARQKGAVEPLGSSHLPSSSLPLPAVHSHRQLSVDAPVFVPTGHSNFLSLGTHASHFPAGRLPDWQPQSSGFNLEGQRFPTPYQLHRPAVGSDEQAHPAVSPMSQSLEPPFSPYAAQAGLAARRDEQVDPVPAFALRKPSPRHSPTSVLLARLPSLETANPYLSSGGCDSRHGVFPFATAAEQPPQLGLAGSPRAWGLLPVLESVGSPFPGMPCRASEQPFPFLSEPSSSSANVLGVTSNATSAALGLTEQSHASIAGSLPGFSSIWSTAQSCDVHNPVDTWQSFTATKQNPNW